VIQLIPDPTGVFPILTAPGTCFANSVVIRQAVPLCAKIPSDNTAIAAICTPALDLALTKTAQVEGALPASLRRSRSPTLSPLKTAAPSAPSAYG
jgi:hypothetical protein